MTKYYPYKPKVNYSLHPLNESNLFPLDEGLLVDLFHIVSESYLEDEMRDYILKFIEMNVPQAVIEYDKYGNLYITKTSKKSDISFYPAIVSHMDEVITDCSSRTVVKLDNIMMGLNGETGEFAGIGGDDKCGIYICLELLRLMDHVKVAFFIAEEVGGEGSGICDLSFFKDCRFILQPDRFGNSSVITNTNSMYVTGADFENDIIALMCEFDYRFDATGTFTDIGVLARRGVNIAVSNISCGYYNQHCEDEVVCLSDLENSLNFIYRIMTDLPDKQYIHDSRSTLSYYKSSSTPVKISTERVSKKPKKFVYLGYNQYSKYNMEVEEALERAYGYGQYHDYEYYDQKESTKNINSIDVDDDYEKAVDIAFINRSKLKTLNELVPEILESYVKHYKSELVSRFGTAGFKRLSQTVDQHKEKQFKKIHTT